MPDVRHSIKVVAMRTGLSAHVIRVWEKRYGTVTPGRTEGNRRLYRSEDIERLRVLKLATDAGHSIGDIARLPTERVARLLAEDFSAGRKVDLPASSTGDAAEWVAAAHEAVVAMNADGLAALLERCSVALGQMKLLTAVIVPLVERIGTEWRDGHLKVAQEHIATATIRTFLGQTGRPMALHPAAPTLVATTPAGQMHELGAALAAAAARSLGWRVVYAGASLPAEEIASAVLAQRALAVALSILHPADDPYLPAELQRLRRLLPAKVHLIVGGAGCAAYATALASCGATMVRDLGQFEAAMDRLRSGAG